MKILRDAVSAMTAKLSSSALVRRLWPQNAGDGLEPSVYGFILRYSWREQIYVVVMTLASFPFLYWSLDLPKQIINRAISGKHFPQPYFGFELNQIPYLVVLCGVFLALILINGWFKLHVNIKKGAAWGADAAPLALRTLSTRAAFSAPSFRSRCARSNRRDGHR